MEVCFLSEALINLLLNGIYLREKSATDRRLILEYDRVGLILAHIIRVFVLLAGIL